MIEIHAIWGAERHLGPRFCADARHRVRPGRRRGTAASPPTVSAEGGITLKQTKTADSFS